MVGLDREWKSGVGGLSRAGMGWWWKLEVRRSARRDGGKCKGLKGVRAVGGFDWPVHRSASPCDAFLCRCLGAVNDPLALIIDNPLFANPNHQYVTPIASQCKTLWSPVYNRSLMIQRRTRSVSSPLVHIP